MQRNATQHNSATRRYVRNALEEQVQRNAMQQWNAKDILELKPKCNATEQCNRKICEKCPRGTSGMQPCNSNDILELKPSATQCNSAAGRYVRNAQERILEKYP